jgi:hypothetical protein
MESRRRQWSFDHFVEDKGAVTGESGMGDEETKVTALFGLASPES